MIKSWILAGTAIHSDCWKAYDCLKNEQFTRVTVNHSLHFKDPETGVHTNQIEGGLGPRKGFFAKRWQPENFHRGLPRDAYVPEKSSQTKKTLIFFFAECHFCHRFVINEKAMKHIRKTGGLECYGCADVSIFSISY